MSQSAVAAECDICLGRVEEAVIATSTLTSAAVHLVPLTVSFLDSWPLLYVVCFLQSQEAL